MRELLLIVEIGTLLQPVIRHGPAPSLFPIREAVIPSRVVQVPNYDFNQTGNGFGDRRLGALAHSLITMGLFDYPLLTVAAALFGIPSLLVRILANLVYDGHPSIAGRIAR